MTVPSNTPQNQAQDAAPRENTEQVNFAQLRKQLEQERAARQRAEEKAEALERQRAAPSSRDDDEGSDEPYVDHRVLERKLKKFESTLDERIDRKAEEKARILLEQEKRNNYLRQKQDFDQVMTPEMMQKLVAKDPELAETILETPEGFTRQKLVYHAIKAIGLDKKEEPKPSIKDVIEKNRRSPYYQPSGGATPPYGASGDFSPAGQKNAYEKLKELKANLRL